MNINRFFNFIGICSAISLALIVCLMLDAFIRNKESPVKVFFRENPGMEPFVIFVFPVILTIGIAWTYRKYRDSKKET